jgi:hypothetical protein
MMLCVIYFSVYVLLFFLGGDVGGANVLSSYMKQQFVTESKKHHMLDSVRNKDRKHDSIQRQHYRFE